MRDDAAREQAFAVFLRGPASTFNPSLEQRRAAFDAVYDAGSAATLAAVVEWLRECDDLSLRECTDYADALEHGALDEVTRG